MKLLGIFLMGALMVPAISQARSSRCESLFNLETPVLRVQSVEQKKLQRMLKEHSELYSREDLTVSELLFETISHATKAEIRFLLANGAKVNSGLEGYEANKTSIFLAAVRTNRMDIVKLLLKEADANPNKSFGGRTALMEAIDNGNIKMVKLLLNSGAKMNGVGVNDHPNAYRSDFTPLMFAIDRNQPQIAMFLIENGARVNYINKNSATALSIARSYQYTYRGIKPVIAKLEEMDAKDLEAVEAERNAAIPPVNWGKVRAREALRSFGQKIDAVNRESARGL